MTRLQRGRAILIALALALVALALTARCEAPGASEVPERGQAPLKSPEAVSAAHRLPDDVFRRCAVKALRGDYGPLAEWQRKGYRHGLEQGAQQVRCWVTTYYPEEGFPRGATTASGHGCSERVAAANRLPRHSWIWTPETGLRQVLDRGARSNDAVAQRRYGADLWVDIWEPRRAATFGDDNAGARTVWCIGG
mgnify:CR=1 FL=1